LLKLGVLDPKRLTLTSEIIARQVNHMNELINDLLDVSRVTSGIVQLDKHIIDVRQILRDSVEQVLPCIQARGHTLSYKSPADTVNILCDRKRIVQIITNLLQNAAKFTPPNGEINLVAEQVGEEFIIRVSDNGLGIEEELLPHIFDLFTQAKRSSDRTDGGLGLGLALVKNLALLHGGRVAASSKGKGQGSSFTVTLPAVLELLPIDHSNDANDVVPKASNQLRLMVVDDNQDAADILAMLFRSVGHRVDVEYEPHAALERVKKYTYDAYVLDMGLPGMDGNELARRLRTNPIAKHATLIALTGYGREFNENSAIDAGFNHYFVKPADVSKLLELLVGIRRV
jgi:CheY-like chemotaxis protein